MALLLNHAILHTVGNRGESCRYSAKELDVDSETIIEFVSKHARSLMKSTKAKEATFSATSAVYEMVKSFACRETSFVETSRKIAERLAGILEGNENIPPADLLIAAFDEASKSYLAVIKLNYGECFTNKQITNEDGTSENRIVKNTTVLPLNTAKVEEACLIPFDPMLLRIVEKDHIISGEVVSYFSQLFLECEANISQKEAADIIQEIADQVNEKHYSGNPETAARIKTAIILEAEKIQEEDGLVLDNVINQVFEENQQAKTDFLELAKERELPHQIMLTKSFVKKEFKMQKFIADNGIEIKCPAEMFDNPDFVSVEENSDGTINITLRNLQAKE